MLISAICWVAAAAFATWCAVLQFETFELPDSDHRMVFAALRLPASSPRLPGP